jgi:regulator of protease activity HflC (stomatin/prohibitin superfamily)
MGIQALVILVFLVLVLASVIKILKEYERAVIFRLGRFIGIKGPGLIILIPFVDRMVRVDLRLVTRDVDPQEIITRDNVTVKVNAVINFRVMDAARAILEVERFQLTTLLLAQTVLRTVLGEAELDELLSQREKINNRLQEILDQMTDPWGIKVSMVQVKDVDLPVEMRRAMAKQAEAERERRARIINAQGEYQAAERLADAARIISDHPQALQLRYLQSLTEVAAENNSTTLFPVPIDLFRVFMERTSKPGGGEATE